LLPERVGTGIKYISIYIYIYIFASSSEDEGILAEGKEQGQKREDLLERLAREFNGDFDTHWLARQRNDLHRLHSLVWWQLQRRDSEESQDNNGSQDIIYI